MKNPYLISFVGLAIITLFFFAGCKKDETKTDSTIPVLAATKAITDITQTTATSGGNITSDGGAAVIARGVCYGKNSKPTININSKTSNGTGEGEFGSSLSGLESNTQYFVRAYATNSKGTGYGIEVSFTTQAAAANVPVLTTRTISDITSTSATSGGNVTSDGGASVTARGVCYGKSSNPNIEINSKTSNGTGEGEFGSSLSGLEAGTKYFVRAYATNSKGTGYGTEVSFTTQAAASNVPVLTTRSISPFTSTSATSGGNVTSDGGSAITARGVCWNTTGNPNADLFTKTSDGTGIGNFTSSITGLTANTTYKVRAYATNANGTGYGNEETFTTSILVTVPVLSTTTSATIITANAARSGGNITSDGNGTITARGVCWGTSPDPAISGSKTSDGTGTGSFTSDLTGLMESTTYYVRSYATNSAGTGYGEQINFTTTATVTDVDGNVYQTVKIGGQTWMKENLKISKYRNGNPITTGLSSNAWETTTTEAYAIYNNDAANNNTYSKLYNWYAVADPRGLCPDGWHVPSDAEWTTLENFLGGTSVAGGKMKAVSNLWQSSNTGATNESGFSGLPGGNRSIFGTYDGIGSYCDWWSSTEYSTTDAWGRGLYYGDGNSSRGSGGKRAGFSVRCLRD